jgi:hypothetical protein
MLFETADTGGFDGSSDGRRFLMVKQSELTGPAEPNRAW